MLDRRNNLLPKGDTVMNESILRALTLLALALCVGVMISRCS